MALAGFASVNFAMKVTHVLTCALMACGMAASAASIEQIFNISVIGTYQGVTTNKGPSIRERRAVARISSVNVVNALAIDYNTDFMNGTLLYKTSMDGSVTNVVIRQRGNTTELDVTTNFNFAVITNGFDAAATNVTAPVVVDQVFNPSVSFTNSYVETGLRFISFTSSSVSFNGIANGSATRTPRITSTSLHTNGFANRLAYAGGVGAFALNTNLFSKTNFQFAATNFVNGPAQINFSTFSPVVSPNDAIPH